ncbi:MAG: multidrug efflux SMR transporter [Candidatus Tectomicrobia bacterium]|nr:multidrug efflux SMR transporter [Candidatus Tectomicrobia bacterium]
MQVWLLLLVAIVLEVAGTTSMKLSNGFTKLVPSMLIFVFYAFSFILLTFTLKHINVSIAYAVWAGMGTALIAAIGMVYFAEPMTGFKLVCVGLIIVGVAGLNLVSTGH